MVIKNREDIKNFIVSIEKQFDVNAWKFNDINIWPILRLELFFHIRKKLFHTEKKKNSAKNTELILQGKIKSYIDIVKKARKHQLFLKELRQKKYLFIAHNDHRINFKNSFYNRYFDTLIDKENLKNNSLFIEIGGKEKSLLYNAEIVLTYQSIIDNYEAYLKIKKKFKNRKGVKFDLSNYNEFVKYLGAIELTKDFSNKFNESGLKKWITNYYIDRLNLFTEILKRVKPKMLFSLCYYSDISVIAAANRLNIKTIDMQHGAIASAHMAYGSWFSIPPQGYDFLPRNYWCWNEPSVKAVNEWAQKNNNYKAMLGGNLWMDYWAENNTGYKENNFILYTLQPDSLSLSQLFPDELVKVVKENLNKWYIRLHPRQLNQMEEIRNYLVEKGIFELVNISDATNEPLPVLFKNCLLHVTNSSASTIEASLFGKKTILIHEIGNLYYADLIEANQAYYLPVNNNFITDFNKILLQQKNEVMEIREIQYDNSLFN